jgi:hypothetical protein
MLQKLTKTFIKRIKKLNKNYKNYKTQCLTI